jgi:pimeloyl-ACP methyl ester carboxylesterase
MKTRAFFKAGALVVAATVLAVSLSGCFNLDELVAPIVYNPTKMAEGDEYQLGDADYADFYSVINGLYPDSSIDSIVPVTFDSSGYTLYGYHLVHTSLGASGKVILYFHGNAFTIDMYWTRAQLLYQTGLNVFIFDYRGFGKSEGEPTEAGLDQDADAALDWLLDTAGVDAADIIIYGFSGGTPHATHLAAHHSQKSAFDKLVLEAPIGSAEMFVQDATLLPLPGVFLTDFKLDNISMIQDVSADLLWLHGTADDFPIPYDSHGLAVFLNHPGEENGDPMLSAPVKYKNIVPDGRHGNLPEVVGFAAYIQGIKDFIEDIAPFGN